MYLYCCDQYQQAHIWAQAEIRKRLADVLKELSSTNQEVEKYEAATEEENTCELCLGIIWQPCVWVALSFVNVLKSQLYVYSLPCGHALCADCLYDYTYHHIKAGHQLHSTTCAFCCAPISCPQSSLRNGKSVSMIWPLQKASQSLSEQILNGLLLLVHQCVSVLIGFDPGVYVYIAPSICLTILIYSNNYIWLKCVSRL